MDFWDATKVMVRRWYLALPLLLLTFAGTGYTATAIEADYVLTSYVQLIPPQISVDEEEARKYPINPWNQLGLEALSQAANYATVDHTFLDRLEDQGYSTNFKITSGDPVAGATIEVIGKTREQATGTTDTVMKRFRDSVLQLQTQYRVRTQDLITAQRLDQGENLERPGGKVKRAIIAVFGTGVLFTCAVTIGLDALLRRRRRRADDVDGGDGVVESPGPAGGPSAGVALPARVYAVDKAHAQVEASAPARGTASRSEPAAPRVYGAKAAPTHVYESRTPPERVNGKGSAASGVYESEAATPGRAPSGETVRFRAPTGAPAKRVPANGSAANGAPVNGAAATGAAANGAAANGSRAKGAAKAPVKPDVPGKPVPPETVGDATIVLPGPRKAADDKGGKRR